MPVRVKANQCIPMGVANGHRLAPDTTFLRKEDDVWVASKPPIHIYVDIRSDPVPTVGIVR